MDSPILMLNWYILQSMRENILGRVFAYCVEKCIATDTDAAGGFLKRTLHLIFLL